MTLCFLDIETTGLSPTKHEIIEIAAAVEDPAVTGGWREFVVKVRPEHIETAHPKALEVNGYTPEKWADAVGLDAALSKLAAFVPDNWTVPAGHNIGFDLSFIKAAYEARGESLGVKYPFGHHQVDTVTVAYEHLKPLGQKSMSLANVCNTLGISNEGAHTALADVRRTIQVWQKLTKACWLQRLIWKRRIAKANAAKANAAKTEKKA